MARPEKYPEWASSGVNVVEPGEGKKDDGWLDAERPPAKWFNWLLNLIYLWIVQIVSELDTLFAADATLQNNIDALGSDNIANDSDVPGTKVSDALESLDSADGIQNFSDMEGDSVEDALNKLDQQRKWFINGCSYGRHSTYEEKIGFSDGYAMDTANELLMRMPRQAGFTYYKNVVNGSGWVAGYDACGIPDGVTVAANTKLAIFLLRLPNGNFDIGFDTSLSAANLIADTNCQATNYRRIGFCMAKSMDGSNANLYKCSQDGMGVHRVYPDSTISAYSYYEKSVDQYGSTYSADVYTPLDGMSCEIMYQVAQPAGTGGAAVCYVCPYGLSTSLGSNWETWAQWHASSSATAPYHSNYIKLPMSDGTLFAKASPYTDILVRFNILGWVDRLDRDFPGS